MSTINYLGMPLAASAAMNPDPMNQYPRVPAQDQDQWARRADGSQKGMGWLGLRQRPDGGVSSEVSVESDGVEYPLMVPGLTPDELAYIMNTNPQDDAFMKNMPPSIMEKAWQHAQRQLGAGKSPFHE